VGGREKDNSINSKDILPKKEEHTEKYPLKQAKRKRDTWKEGEKEKEKRRGLSTHRYFFVFLGTLYLLCL